MADDDLSDDPVYLGDEAVDDQVVPDDLSDDTVHLGDEAADDPVADDESLGSGDGNEPLGSGDDNWADVPWRWVIGPIFANGQWQWQLADREGALLDPI